MASILSVLPSSEKHYHNCVNMPKMRDIGEYEVFRKKELEPMPAPDELDLGDGELPDLGEDYNEFNGGQEVGNNFGND